MSLGGGGSTDTDDEFEEERTIAAKVETKLQTVIKNLDKEIKARRGQSMITHRVLTGTFVMEY